MNEADLSEEEMQFLESYRRCGPQGKRTLHRALIRALTRQIDKQQNLNPAPHIDGCPER